MAATIVTQTLEQRIAQIVCNSGLTEKDAILLMAEIMANTYLGNSLNVGDAPAHDYIAISYIGATNNIYQVIFKTGGAAGTVVATWTLAYAGAGAADNDKLTSVTKA